MLQNLLEKNGSELWRRANRIDETPVVPYHEQKSISTENTFGQDTTDMNFMRAEMIRMTERIAYDITRLVPLRKNHSLMKSTLSFHKN